MSCSWQELVLAKNLSVIQENLISKKAQEGHKINQGSTLVVSDTASARQSMNKPLTGLFYFLHTIRHINKAGLARNKFLAIVDDCGLRIA